MPSCVRDTTEQKPGSAGRRPRRASVPRGRLDTSVFRNGCPLRVGGTGMSSLGGQPPCGRLADFPSMPFRAGRRGSWLQGCSLWAGHWRCSQTWAFTSSWLKRAACWVKGPQQEEALGGYHMAEAEYGSEEGRLEFVSCIGQWCGGKRLLKNSRRVPLRTSTERLHVGGQSVRPTGRGDRILRTSSFK